MAMSGIGRDEASEPDSTITTIAERDSTPLSEVVLSKEECRLLNYRSCDSYSRSRIVTFTGSKRQSIEESLTEILSNYPHSQVGPHTFFPKQEEYYDYSVFVETQESPVLWAAKAGNTSDLKFFLSDRFCNVIDVNFTGTCSFPSCGTTAYDSSEVTHKCTALYAACRGNSKRTKEVVEHLVSRGASVNIPNCRKTSPLMEAASKGNLDVVKYLLKHKADVNAANMVGKSVLSAAASRGHNHVVKYLLKGGADIETRNIQGETALHTAAREGHAKTVQHVLAHSSSETLQSLSSPSSHPLPPIILAAAEGHEEVVDVLLTASSNCPPHLHCDALLLLGAKAFEKKQEVSTLLQPWTKALTMRATLSLTPNFLSPMECYGNRVEIRTLDDFEKIKDSPLELLYQCLILRERIVGFGHRISVNGLIFSMRIFVKLAQCPEIEPVWNRTLEAIFKLATGIPFYDVQIRSHLFVHVYYPRWVQYLKFSLDFYKYIYYRQNRGTLINQSNIKPSALFAIRGLELLEIPCPDLECVKPDFLPLILTALKIFSFWLHLAHVRLVEEQGDEVPSDIHDSFPFLDSDCEVIGQSFVSKYLHPSNKCTLLHVALDSKNVKDLKSVPLLISALLRWGADSVINEPDSQGARPLHLAIKHADPDTVIHLVDSGAHLDAVDGDGKTPAELYLNASSLGGSYSAQTTRLLFAALPLSCLCCRQIVLEGFPYESMDLPSHVKTLLRLHDRP